MEPSTLTIDSTPKTPLIDFNQLSGELIISGRSTPENAAKIFNPVLNWIKDYVPNAKPVTNLRLNLEYFNTSSMIWLSKIIKVLKQINKPDYIIYLHLYMPVEDYDEMHDPDDIMDALIPVRDMLQDTRTPVCIKLYGTNERNEIVKDALVFI